MSPKYSQTVLDEILSKVDIVDLVGHYVHLSPKGNNFWGLCPFHGEKTPSFSVAPQKNIYYCFGCHKGGGPLQFLMDIEGVGFQDALKVLSQKTGIALPDQGETPVDKEKGALLELNKKISATFLYLLQDGEESEIARSILKNRGINEEMQKAFFLGYAPADRYWLHKFLVKKSYQASFLKTSGLFSSKFESVCLFSGRLMFPIVNHRQEVIGFGGRALLQDQGPKYINSPETPVFKKGSNLYGIHLAMTTLRQEKVCWICEGYMDVISLHQAGIKTALAPLGTAFTKDQALFLKKYIHKVIFLFDSDQAGINATLKSMRVAEEVEMESEVLTLASGKDPAEILEKEGAESLQNHLKNPINSFEFLLNFLYNTYYQKSVPDVDGFLRGLFDFLNCVVSQVKREAYLNLAAAKLGVPKTALTKDAARRLSSQKVEVLVPPSQKRGKDLGASVEMYVLLAAITNRKYLLLLRRYLTKEDFEGRKEKIIFNALEYSADHNEESLESLFLHIQDSEIQQDISQKLLTGEFDTNQEIIIKDGVNAIQLRNMQKKIATVQNKITQIEKEAGDWSQIQSLLVEKKYLDQELLKIKGDLHV